MTGDQNNFLNALCLEEKYGWNGLIVDPHPAEYQTGLLIHRKVCTLTIEYIVLVLCRP